MWTKFTTGVEIGDAAILSYNLQWDQGLGGLVESDWADLVGNPANLISDAFIATNGIVGGQWFNFRVRAKNVYGFGLFSDPVSFKASQEPDQVVSSTIVTQNILTQVKITWDEPFDNYDTITAYNIEIRHSDDETFTESAECDGLDSTVASTRECFVELATLRAAPCLLAFNSFVIVRVKSLNTFGWSEFSQPNAGGAII